MKNHCYFEVINDKVRKIYPCSLSHRKKVDDKKLFKSFINNPNLSVFAYDNFKKD